MSKVDKQIEMGTLTWQQYYDSLNNVKGKEGLRYIAEYGQATQGQTRTIDGLRQANINARAAVEVQNMTIKKASLSYKAATVAAKAFAIAGNMLLMWGVSKAIELTAKAIDNYVHRLDNAKEALSETQTSLNSVQSEIDDTTAKIKDLESLETLSITDKEDLEQLRLQNKELEIRQKYLKEQEQSELEKVANLSKERYNTTYGVGAGDRENIDKYKTSISTSSTQPTTLPAYLTGNSSVTTSSSYAAGQQAQEINNQSESLSALIAKYELFEEKKKEAIQSEDSEAIEKYNKKLDEIRLKLIDDRTALQEFKDDIGATGKESPELNAIVSQLNLIDDTLLSKGEQFEKFLNADSFAESKQGLIDLASQGNLTSDELSENFADLDSYMKENGITLDDLIAQLKVINTESDKVKSNISFTDLFSSLPMDQLEEYIALLKSGAIDEKTISSFSDLASMMEQTGTSAKDALTAIKDFSDGFTLSKDLISGIQDGYNLIESAKKNIKDLKVISLDTLNSITAKYPQLQDEAAAYTQGLITTEDMMYALQTAYDADADNFRNAMAAKLSGNETFFSTIKNNNQGLFDELANAYGLDVKNWKTMAQAKAEIDQKLIQNLSSAWSKYYGIVVDAATGLTKLTGNAPRHGSSQGVAFSDPEQAKAYAAALDAVTKANALKNKLDQAANIEVEVPDFGGIGADKSGSGSKDKKEKDPTIFDWIAIAAEQAEKKIEQLQNKINDTSGWKPKNALTDTTIDEMANKLTALQAMADSYQKAADSYDVSPTYIDKIKNGTLEIEAVTDETIAKNIKGYQEWYNKAKEMRKQIDETKRAMKALAQTKLDNIINDFNSLTSLMGKYSDYLSGLLELQGNLGESISDTDYKGLIDRQEAIYNQLQNKYKTLSAELKNAVDSGAIEVGSEEWRKYNEELIDVNSSMRDTISSMNTFRQSIVNLSFKELEQFADAIDRINKGTDTLLNILGDDGLMDGGMITTKGLAQIALYGQQYTNAKQQAAEYANAIDALNDMYHNGSITEAEYNERLNDYTNAQLSAVEATKAAEQAILQFRYDAIQAQIDDMNDLISAKKKALQEEKDYQDYIEKVNNKQNDINNLQKKIAELSLSTDRRDIAQRLELEKQLADAKKELSDAQADYAFNQTQESLDKQAEEYEDAKEKELKELKSSYEKQQEVIKKYLSQVKDNYDSVYKTLTEYGVNYNVSMTEELTSPWASADNAVTSFTDAISTAVSKINIEIDSINISRLTELIDAMNSFSSGSNGFGDSVGKNFKDATIRGKWKKAADGERWWYGNSDDDYVSGGIYTINGKQYSFDDEGYMQTEWQNHNGSYYYFDASDGHMVKSQWIPGNNGEYYYLTSDGTMAGDQAIKDKSDSNKYYYVDDQGIWDGETIDYEEVKRRNLKVGYRTGTKNAVPGLHPVEENGPELLVTEYGTLARFNGGETVFNDKMTKTLWEFASAPHNYLNDVMSRNTSVRDFAPERGGNVTVEINSPLTVVEGNADEKTLSAFESRLSKWATKELPDIIRKDMKGR
ncbi:MAG: hypothetical protein LUH21_03825 [Clostridiales bacterium]|nr:hypothetical protein [Clostridiales bacterium]